MASERDITAEQLPRENSILSLEETQLHMKRSNTETSQTTDQEENAENDMDLARKVESILLELINNGSKIALFQLGQLYFEEEKYEKAAAYFKQAAEHEDFQAIFQLGIIYYDGLGGQTDHAYGVENMMKVANSNHPGAKHLIRAAQYNVGRACFQGFGVRQSDGKAEEYWLLAADDGNPKASVKAQSMLGMFYSMNDCKDLNKAFYWHSEACGNGSLESQGALGVMYQLGLGTKKDIDSAFVCLREAAERGNVYAKGHLIAYYYKNKFHGKAVILASRVALLEDVQEIAHETDCLAHFIAKGIALACFYYARCLQDGLGVTKSLIEAKKFFSKSFQYDSDICATLQERTQHGQI